MEDQQTQMHDEMQTTKSALEQKLESLGSQVAATFGATADAVQSARAAMASTIEDVKGAVESVTETVHDTAASVGRTFDVRRQVENHPWLVFGGSVAAGCAAGYFLPWPRRAVASTFSSLARPLYQAASSASESEPMSWFQGASPTSTEPTSSESKSFFSEELDKLKGLAIGSLLGVARDLLVRELPEALGQRLAEEMNTITTKLGGETIKDKLIDDAPEQAASNEPEADEGNPAAGSTHNGGGKSRQSSVEHHRMRQAPPTK